MANISQKQKQQQFGLKLVLIALVVGITFTVWYFAEKTWNKETGNTPKTTEVINKVNIPGDDLSSLKDKYLGLAEQVMSEGYGNVMLTDSFKLMLGWKEDGINGEDSHGYVVIGDVKAANNFWKGFLVDKYGEINKKNIDFRVLGNSVQISFQMEKLGKTNSFKRTLVFGNYQKDQRNIAPAIMSDMLEKITEDTNDQKIQDDTKKVGDTVSYEPVDTVKNNQIKKVQIFSKDNNQWKILFFYPADFSNTNPASYLSLIENAGKFSELKTDLMVVSVDPIDVHQAWEKMYFGKLPFYLVADTDKGLVKMFGLWNKTRFEAYQGTVVLDPQNRVQYMSVQNNVSDNAVDYLKIVKELQTSGK